MESLDLAPRPVPQAPFCVLRRSVFGFSVGSGEKRSDLGAVGNTFLFSPQWSTGCIVLGEGWAQVLLVAPFAIHFLGYNSRGIGHPVLFVLGLLTPCQCCKTPSRDGL